MVSETSFHGFWLAVPPTLPCAFGSIQNAVIVRVNKMQFSTHTSFSSRGKFTLFTEHILGEITFFHRICPVFYCHIACMYPLHRTSHLCPGIFVSGYGTYCQGTTLFGCPLVPGIHFV